MKGKNKIILFPKLKERLYSKGMEALKEKRYKEALQNFEQYSTLYPNSKNEADLQVGIVICLLETGSITEAKEKCKWLLHSGIGDYFSVLQIYITILIQLHEYTEVVSTIEAIMHESKLPPDRAEQFYQLLDFARKMESQSFTTPIKEGNSFSDYSTTFDQMIETNEMDKQMLLVNEMFNANVTEVFPFFKKLLVEKIIHPVIKTMILQHLIEQEIREKVKVQKQENIKTINIHELENVLEQKWMLTVLKKLEDELASENPTLYDAVKQIFEHFCFIQYPFLPFIKNENVWAAALHKVGYEIHGIDIEDGEISTRYDVPIEKVYEVKRRIYEAEQF